MIDDNASHSGSTTSVEVECSPTFIFIIEFTEPTSVLVHEDFSI